MPRFQRKRMLKNRNHLNGGTLKSVSNLKKLAEDFAKAVSFGKSTTPMDIKKKFKL